MIVDCFLDTNVLVYAAAGSGLQEEKRKRALRLMERESFGISAQVLQEFYVTVVRKAAAPMSPEKALEWIEALEAFPCQPLDSGLVKVAIEISERIASRIGMGRLSPPRKPWAHRRCTQRISATASSTANCGCGILFARMVRLEAGRGAYSGSLMAASRCGGISVYCLTLAPRVLPVQPVAPGLSPLRANRAG